MSLSIEYSSKREEIRLDPLEELPIEINWKIFSQLPPEDLEQCRGVSALWQTLANDPFLPNPVPENAFGKKQWKQYFDVDVEEPRLPLNIYAILNRKCRFSNSKEKVKDTQLLVLIPESINEEPLTLETFGKLIKSKFPEFGGNGYHSLWNTAKDCKGNGKARWVLLTRNVLDSSRFISIKKHENLVKERGKGEYHVPSALDVVVCVISEYVRHKIRLYYNDELPTYTLCQEHFTDSDSKNSDPQNNQVLVGDFSPKGLNVTHSVPDDNDNHNRSKTAILRQICIAAQRTLN